VTGITIAANTTCGGNPSNTIISGTGTNGIFTYLSTRVTFIIDNLTFRNGRTLFLGGAINAPIGTPTVYVTSSTFNDCSASNFINGEGGAIYAHGPVRVISSAFTNCSASGGIFGGGGGAIVGGRGITLLFSRLYNNTASQGADIYFYGSGSLIAPDNWWGTNTPAFSSRISGAPGPSSWLVLGIPATPASIDSAGTALVTANLSNVNTSGYYSTASLNVPEDIPVVFMLPSGSGRVLPGAGTISANANSTLFIPTPSTGTAIVNATVDGQTVSVAIPVT
jgi:hypothetical protein